MMVTDKGLIERLALKWINCATLASLENTDKGEDIPHFSADLARDSATSTAEKLK